jgi:hypothetical protein
MDKQIRRLLNKQKNNNFKSQKNNGIILDLLRTHRQAVLKPLYFNLNQV